jgi:hypothetical protein
MGMLSLDVIRRGTALLMVFLMIVGSGKAANAVLRSNENRLQTESEQSHIVRSGETQEAKYPLNVDLLPRAWAEEGKHDCRVGGTHNQGARKSSRALLFTSLLPVIRSQSSDRAATDSLANDKIQKFLESWKKEGTNAIPLKLRGDSQLVLEDAKIGKGSWRRRMHQRQHEEQRLHRLSIIAYFKNEGHILFEWVMHHLNQGVDHIYLVDNYSGDGYKKDNIHWLAHLVNMGKITITQWKGRQRDAYNKIAQLARKETKWLTVIDLDEFMYSPVGTSLSETLEEQYNYTQVREVRLHWKLLSMGANLFQKQSIIAGNVMGVPGVTRDLTNKGSYWSFKTIASMAFDVHFLVHFHLFPCKQFLKDDKPRPMELERGDFTRFKSLTKSGGKFCRTDRLVEAGFQSTRFVQLEPGNKLIRLNHYRFQSWEHLLGIKERRGGGLKSNKYRDAASQYARLAPSFTTVDDGLRTVSDGLIQWIRCLSTTNHISAGLPKTALYGETQQIKDERKISHKQRTSHWPVVRDYFSNETSGRSDPASEHVDEDVALSERVLMVRFGFPDCCSPLLCLCFFCCASNKCENEQGDAI